MSAFEVFFSLFADHVRHGGLLAWTLVGISVVSLAVALERIVDLYVLRRLDVASFVAILLKRLERQQLSEALAACNVSTRHPLVDVVRAGLSRADQRETVIERAMDREAMRARVEVNRRLEFLYVLAMAAPIVGLIGTAFGFVLAFESLGLAQDEARQSLLAASVTAAAYSAALALLVAGPTLVLHRLLVGRAQTIDAEAREGALSVLVGLGSLQSGKPRASARPPARASRPPPQP